MVKVEESCITEDGSGKGFWEEPCRPRRITASTTYGTCTERLSPFGGLLGLIKFLDLLKFEEVFDRVYREPSREPKLGHYRMVVGILMLLFIGFNRLWHFVYIRLDAMVCGFFQLVRLPAASTFWRYVDSLTINQGNSILKVSSVLRERAWQLCALQYRRIHLSIDTTAETVYGNQQGGRLGYNTNHRGKKAYRPVLCFVDETRECLLGKLRKGDVLDGEESAAFITQIKGHLPGCVKQVLLRADGEFFSWESVFAATKAGFDFIIANKRAKPPFNPGSWYQLRRRNPIQYNSCVYQPIGWQFPCRFVAMRIPKEQNSSPLQPLQGELFEEDRYTYRIFCTHLRGKPHKIIAQYDKRADAENLIGEAKREGLDAIPSAKFKNNYAYLQIVMLAYNLWRYYKMLAQRSTEEVASKEPNLLEGIQDNTIRIARLKLLLIAAKLAFHNNRDQVKFSLYDSRTPSMQRFMRFLDNARAKARPWIQNSLWPCRFSVNLL
jgi:Transposase DDE domain group 1